MHAILRERTVSTILAMTIAVVSLASDAGGQGCCDAGAFCYESSGVCSKGGTFVDHAFCNYEAGHCVPIIATSTTLPGGPWPGLSDGRLNPDPAEYYSIWCGSDHLEVWRGVPSPVLLDVIPIVDVIELAEGGVFETGAVLTVTRNSADTITIYGSNGNGAPTPGSKAFSLSECIARNGGLPETGERVPTGPAGTEPVDPEPDYTEACFTLEDAGDILDCLSTDPELSGLEFCWLRIFEFKLLPSYAPPGALRPLGTGAGGGFYFLRLYFQLHVVRDQVLNGTPGGRRATQLYYGHNKALLDSAFQNPQVLTAGRTALESWAPVVEDLVAGTTAATPQGAGGVVVTADQVRTFQDFLGAVRTGASPALRAALEREVLLVDPASFAGLTAAQMVERLERLSCEAATTLPSVRCRLGNLKTLVQTHVTGKPGKQLTTRVSKASTQAERAEAAGGQTKKLRAALRRLQRLLGSIERQLGKKRVVQTVREDVRLALGETLSALKTDTQTLAP